LKQSRIAAKRQSKIVIGNDTLADLQILLFDGNPRII